MNELSLSESSEKLTTVLSGIAGEYFVAAELSRRGFTASITLRNSRGVDVLATNADASRSAGIQVKTNQGSRRSWILNSKAETFFSDTLFYVFVNLNGTSKQPDFFIVPSKIVSRYITEGHATWLKTPGENGESHRDTNMRKFDDHEDRYLSRWDLLGLTP